MFREKDLTSLGLPYDAEVVRAALKAVKAAVASGLEKKIIIEEVRELARNPQAFFTDEIWSEAARLLDSCCPGGTVFTPRAAPAPWKKWGDINLDYQAIEQMEKAALLPVAVRGALMPDAHTGYGLPIGGVLAVKDAVIPYAVGVDIACRMRLSILDMPVSALLKKRDKLAKALEAETRFGVGAGFEGSGRHHHMVMDEDWNVSPVTAKLKDKAWNQLGSSGGGNHFVEFGELHVAAPVLGLEPGVYLALLSHSGSRGSGEAVAGHYSKLAMELRPALPKVLRHLAWLDIDSEPGLEYWNAMQLMGRYASAGHELIHRHVLEAIGAEALAHVENHHNFAWREEHDGQSLIVHRKGATPAGEGVLGVVPGSMGSPGFVVRGRGNAESLCSCSHGAGRVMSRSAAISRFKRAEVDKYLKNCGVELLSGGLDEAPMAYKDIHRVMEAQSDLVDVLARFEPRLVKMAPEERRSRRPGGKKRR